MVVNTMIIIPLHNPSRRPRFARISAVLIFQDRPSVAIVGHISVKNFGIVYVFVCICVCITFVCNL